jgi:hypothetical protein
VAPKRQDVCKVCGVTRIENRMNMALCAEHLREYTLQNNRKQRASGAVCHDPQYRRLNDYRAEAQRIGADEAEAWWCAVAAEIGYQRGDARARWLTPFITSELAWLRANRPILAKLDAARWAAPTGDQAAVVVDDGYDIDEGAA